MAASAAPREHHLRTAKILIYGATGYTGRLVSEQARRTGLAFEIAGRSDRLARRHSRCQLRGTVRRNSTADHASLHRCRRPLPRHHCRIQGIRPGGILAESWSERAAAAGVMLLPGVGWDVVPSDCLAAHTANRVAHPQRLRIALEVAGSMSRGLATSEGWMLRQIAQVDSQLSRMRSTIGWLRQHYAEPLRIEVLAAHAGMSLSALHRRFKATTALSPLQFQKQLRLLEARRMLTTASSSVTTVAYSVGYESPSQFGREYLRMFGRSPGQDQAGSA